MREKDLSPQEFFESIDWEDWYHEFATATTRLGQPKYASSFAFAQAKGKSRQQRDIILHVVGPKIAGRSPAYELEQYDWEKRRKDGFWIGPEKLTTQIEKVLQQAGDDNLRELQASAQAFILPQIAKLAAMMDKIEAEFSGHLFMPNLSDKMNETRANLYMRLTDHVTNSIIKLQESYARSLMTNVNDLLGTVAIREHLAASKISQAENKGNRTLGLIVEMIAEKGKSMKLGLPDPDIAKVVQERERVAS